MEKLLSEVTFNIFIKVTNWIEWSSVQCAVFSAGLRVVMLRVADSLDLADNTTCHIYHG